MRNNYDFKNANINIEYSETANGYYIEISAKDFWNSITNEEMKKDISEYYENNITAETLNQEFKGYNTNIVKAIKETTGIKGNIYEITIIEEPTEQTKENTKMNAQIEIHPNTLYNNIQLEDLGYTAEHICEISEVDADVFDSHTNYQSALYVADEIANEINNQIQQDFFNGAQSLVDDERYELTTDGEYTLKYKFTQKFNKFTGEDILTEFGVNNQNYFTTETDETN